MRTVCAGTAVALHPDHTPLIIRHLGRIEPAGLLQDSSPHRWKPAPGQQGRAPACNGPQHFFGTAQVRQASSSSGELTEFRAMCATGSFRRRDSPSFPQRLARSFIVSSAVPDQSTLVSLSGQSLRHPNSAFGGSTEWRLEAPRTALGLRHRSSALRCPPRSRDNRWRSSHSNIGT
jgi:hypothetical protein